MQHMRLLERMLAEKIVQELSMIKKPAATSFKTVLQDGVFDKEKLFTEPLAELVWYQSKKIKKLMMTLQRLKDIL